MDTKQKFKILKLLLLAMFLTWCLFGVWHQAKRNDRQDLEIQQLKKQINDLDIHNRRRILRQGNDSR